MASRLLSITCSAERQDMTKEMQGKRIADGIWPKIPGEYSKFPHGEFMVMLPNGITGCIRTHKIEEHEDGTITVSPSILFEKDNIQPGWHGYLEKGIWREC